MFMGVSAAMSTVWPSSDTGLSEWVRHIGAERKTQRLAAVDLLLVMTNTSQYVLSGPLLFLFLYNHRAQKRSKLMSSYGGKILFIQYASIPGPVLRISLNDGLLSTCSS